MRLWRRETEVGFGGAVGEKVLVVVGTGVPAGVVVLVVVVGGLVLEVE